MSRETLVRICTGHQWNNRNYRRHRGELKVNIKWSNHVDPSGVLELIRIHAGVEAPYLQREKITACNVGDQHQQILDRQRAPNHVGTLIITLNCVNFKGGDLVINTVPVPVPSAVFIPCGVSYSVSPVLEGQRIALVASVYRNKPANIIVEHDVEIDADTRLVLSTGLRMPTQDELNVLREKDPRRGYLAIRSAISRAKGKRNMSCD